jgi:hypothetical protein
MPREAARRIASDTKEARVRRVHATEAPEDAKQPMRCARTSAPLQVPLSKELQPSGNDIPPTRLSRSGSARWPLEGPTNDEPHR